MKKMFLAISPLLLVGCQNEIQVPISLNDFYKKDSQQIVSKMAIEISSCKEYKTDMPSDSLFKVQKKIPYIFKGAEYKKCLKDGFNSYALFTLPVNIDNEIDGKSVDERIINLSFNPDNNGYRALKIYIPTKLRKSINQLVNSDSSIKVDDIKISLKIDPEGKKGKFNMMGGYLGDTPVQWGDYTNNGGKFKITIPTYGIKLLLAGDNTYAAMLNAKFE